MYLNKFNNHKRILIVIERASTYNYVITKQPYISYQFSCTLEHIFNYILFTLMHVSLAGQAYLGQCGDFEVNTPPCSGGNKDTQSASLW